MEGEDSKYAKWYTPEPKPKVRRNRQPKNLIQFDEDGNQILYGKWRPIEHVRTERTGAVWLCECTGCGTRREVKSVLLTSGRSKSCGASGCRTRSPRERSEDRRDPRLYNIYTNLVEQGNKRLCRCTEDGTPIDWTMFANFDRFADRYIPHMSWEEFREDALAKGYVEGPLCSLTLALIPQKTRDGREGYTWFPSTSKWSRAPPESLANTGFLVPALSGEVRYYKNPYTGQVLSRSQICELYGIPTSTFTSRALRGWSLAEIIQGHRDAKDDVGTTDVVE